MNEALVSILCDNHWKYDIGDFQSISFNWDGSGEVLMLPVLNNFSRIAAWKPADQCRQTLAKIWYTSNFLYVLVANHTWRTLPRPKSDEDDIAIFDDESQQGSRKPQILGKLSLEITLSPTLAKSIMEPPGLGSVYHLLDVNTMYFSEPAFQPRVFTVQLEKGDFIAQLRVGCDNRHTHRWGLRLRFDQSPIPAREGFKSHECPIPAAWLDDIRYFVARSLPDSEGKGRAMNDIPSRIAWLWEWTGW